MRLGALVTGGAATVLPFNALVLVAFTAGCDPAAESFRPTPSAIAPVPAPASSAAGIAPTAAPTLEARLWRAHGAVEAPRFDRAVAKATLLELESALARRLQGENPDDLLTALSEVLFDELGFEREIDDHDPRFTLLGPVLERRRGNCVGLGTALLVAAERLSRDVEGTMAPGHFFLLVSEPAFGVRNLELLRRGEPIEDAWYRQRYDVPPRGGAYLRPLTGAEVEAIVYYNIGAYFRREGKLDRSGSAYGRAVELFPELAEAHAGLGAVEQLRGRLGAARLSYRRAMRENPNLGGLATNLEQLRAAIAARAERALPSAKR